MRLLDQSGNSRRRSRWQWSGLILLLAVLIPQLSYGAECARFYFEKPASWPGANVWAWNEEEGCNLNGVWPGDAMTAVSAGSSVYYWEGPEGKIPTLIIVSNSANQAERFQNGSRDGSVPFVNNMTYTITGDYSYVEYPDPVDPVDPDDPYDPGVENYVYFRNVSYSATPFVWAWREEGGRTISCNINQTWPGDPMEKVSDGLYVWKLPVSVIPTGIIFSEGGEVKTDDLVYRNKATYTNDGSYVGGEDPVIPKDGPGKILDWSNDGVTVTVNCENATLFITPYYPEVVKVFTLPAGMSGEERRSITVSGTPSVEYVVEDGEGALLIRVEGGCVVSVDREAGLISYRDHSGNEKLTEANYLNNHTHTVGFQSQGGDAFFGGGYNGSYGSLANHTLIMDNFQTGGWFAGYNESNHNICIPFVASTNGYGILVDDHYRRAELSMLGNGLTYKTGATDPISYYYIGGENLDEVVVNYSMLTGRHELPPYWTLGYVTSRYGYHSESEANNVINSIKGMDIPLDGIVFDLYWQGADESGMGNLDWYTPNFPNAKDMLAGWKEQGIHTTCITEPFFTSRSANYETLRSKGYLAYENVDNMQWLQSPSVGLLDASNPEALDWMWEYYKARTAEGVDGWWLDLGEPEQHDWDSNHKGGSVDQVHNEFGNLWVERVHRGLKEEFPNIRPFIMPRAGTSGMQRFGTFPWSGDIRRSWEGLQAQVTSLVHMSMAGVPYMNSDTGGFTADNGYVNANLYLRWIQFACLSPMMRTHSATLPEPYNDCYSSVADDVRNFINLHYRLIPYVYTMAYHNASTGLPMARPACIYDSNPSLLANNNDSYLWGKDIFVAPVMTDGNSRSITFPEGEWVDFNDMGAVYSGGTTVNYSAPLNLLPYFMRKGSFIPMFSQKSGFGSTKDLKYSDITLYHFVNDKENGVSEGEMYEDDRTSTSNLEDNAFALLKFRGERSESGYHIVYEPELGSRNDFMAEERTIRLHLRGYTGPEQLSMECSGVARENVLTYFDVKNNESQVDAAEGNAYCVTPDGEYYVKATVPSSSRVDLYFGAVNVGVVETLLGAGMRLGYNEGELSYLLPPGYMDGEVSVYGVDGSEMFRQSGLNADGVVNTLQLPLSTGVYIARLSGRAANGTAAETTAKFVVK